MAGSIADNTTFYKKKTYTYVPPSPPAELIDPLSYTIDFAARKFLQIGIDPSEKFQVVVHVLTSSRYVLITVDLMKKIFSYMGNILSFILATPHKYKRIIFYEDEKNKLSSMMYSGENVLVMEAKNREGCRVLLNRADLMRLQYLEKCIFETIVRKEVFAVPLVMKQYDEIVQYIDKKCAQQKSSPNNVHDMVIFIKNIQVDGVVKSIPNFSNQIQMCAAEQLSESLLNQRANNSHEFFNKTRIISPISSPTPMSPPVLLSPPPSPIYAIKSSVDENDGPSFFNMQPLSETGDFDSAVSELH
ncbi:uncharacterized protein LOC126555165 [Aphis gossypii]|uniref:uncharacterized protein LOC126555165 n=1 Tax=Aphis gossypii TaxID=80765 RepID=UPI0021593E8A|nr:uncharacterized protein LOC126555165 [Aphis gossypii]